MIFNFTTNFTKQLLTLNIWAWWNFLLCDRVIQVIQSDPGLDHFEGQNDPRWSKVIQVIQVIQVWITLRVKMIQGDPSDPGLAHFDPKSDPTG